MAGSVEFVEIAKIVLPPLVTILIAGAFGHRLAAYWSLKQKQREAAQERADLFFQIYGEFFSTWKTWNFLKDTGGTESPGKLYDIFQKAASSEGMMESLVVKLCAEVTLEQVELAQLGCFRQAYQSLRQSVRAGERLDWGALDCVEYLAFKRLSMAVASVISIERHRRRSPSMALAKEQLEKVTAHEWASNWTSVIT